MCLPRGRGGRNFQNFVLKFQSLIEFIWLFSYLILLSSVSMRAKPHQIHHEQGDAIHG